MRKKLTSRKLWLAVIGFVTAICVLFGVEDIKIEQICALIGALGTLVAYILAEGCADANGAKSDTSPDASEENEPNNEQKEEKS